MKTYKIFDVYVNDGVVYIHCTDPDTLKTIICEVKQYVPSMRSSEGAYRASLDKLQGRERQVKWWIMQQLCLKGWEPFGVTYSSFEGSYSFRLEETF